jgi:polar amino acid transport system substrate-binding protein
MRGAVLPLCLGVLLGAGLLSCGKAPPALPGPAPLVVGMDLSYPPFETIDSRGIPAGISVDLAQDLGTFLKRPVRIENIPFTGLIPSLLTGKIDVILSSMTDTPEREKTISFSDSYLTIGLALLKGTRNGLSGPGDLDQADRVIAVRQGTTGEVWAREHLKRARILPLDKESSAVLEVIQGRADGFLYEQMSVWKNHQEHPAETTVLLEPLQTESWAVGLRPGDAALRGQVNAFLRSYRASGGFDRLGERYLKDQKEAFAKSGIPFYF